MLVGKTKKIHKKWFKVDYTQIDVFCLSHCYPDTAPKSKRWTFTMTFKPNFLVFTYYFIITELYLLHKSWFQLNLEPKMTIYDAYFSSVRKNKVIDWRRKFRKCSFLGLSFSVKITLSSTMLFVIRGYHLLFLTWILARYTLLFGTILQQEKIVVNRKKWDKKSLINIRIYANYYIS